MRSGLSFVELLIVLAFFAVLAAVVPPSFTARNTPPGYASRLNNQRQRAFGLLSCAQEYNEALGLLSCTQEHNEAFPLPPDWITARGVRRYSRTFDCPTSMWKGTIAPPATV